MYTHDTRTLETKLPFTEKETINIGEEISDVFIYTTRLCEICRIDLPYGVRSLLQPDMYKFTNESDDAPIVTVKRGDKDLWTELSFEELDERTRLYTPYNSMTQRQLALSIQSEVGRACDIFKYKTEIESPIGLVGWNITEVAALRVILATICILLACLARASNHELGTCIASKFNKNDLKYPVSLSKGSSKKYTAYTSQTDNKFKFPAKMGFTLLLLVAGFAVGRFSK